MAYAAKRAAVALASATLLSVSLTATAVAETEWDLPLAWPDGNFHVENAKTFAKVVEQVTGGEITINIHPGGSLGFKGPEMLNAVGDGLVPVGEMLLNQQVGERKILGLETQPYIIEDLDQLAVFHKHFRPAIERVAAEYNQKVLYVVPWPRQYVYTKVEARGVADLAGIKIRTYNDTTTEMFNRIGMTSVQLPWGEVVPSLAAGTIDAVTTSASSGVDGKFWEFLTHMYPTSHVWSSNMVSVNLDAWNDLTEGSAGRHRGRGPDARTGILAGQQGGGCGQVENPERARGRDGRGAGGDAGRHAGRDRADAGRGAGRAGRRGRGHHRRLPPGNRALAGRGSGARRIVGTGFRSG